jgi:hypothetical protein
LAAICALPVGKRRLAHLPSQKRSVATLGSWLYCSKNIQRSMSAWAKRSAGISAEPLARYQQAALLSGRKRSRRHCNLQHRDAAIGVDPSRKAGVRVSPLRIS